MRLEGPWCHACGQLGEDFHRSAHHLVAEAIEGLFHADGRLVRTVPRLVLRPGRLTRDYLAGKRAPQIPPLRLFLVAVLVVFLAGSGNRHITPIGVPDNAAARAEAKKVAAGVRVEFGPLTSTRATTWLRSRLPRAIDHPDALVAAMGEWAHRFAFLALPLSAFILAAVFAFRRDTFLFDHLVFSMHSLSFQGFLVALVVLLPSALQPATLLLLSPVHLFVHMRGTYGTGVVGTLLRMAILFAASIVAFSLLMFGLVLVGLNELAD